MYIEKSVIISKPRREVFDYIRHIRNQDHYSVWNMQDPNQKTTFSGEDGSVGFIYSWDSQDKNVGAGSQEIKRIVDNELVESELRFERPMKSVATSTMKISEASPTQTKVSWSFDGKMKFPLNILSFVMKGVLGKQLQQGLNNLKNKLESNRG